MWEYLWAGSSITKWLYHLNGNSLDSSGNGFDLTNNWSTPYSDWKFWQCIDFWTSNTNKYLSNSSFTNLCSFNNWLTISFWVNFNNVTFSSQQNIISSTDTWWNWVFFRVDSTTATAFRFGNSIVNDWWTTNINKSWSSWVWYNVIMTHSPTANNYYIDWVLVATRTTNVTMSWWSNGINIGRHITGDSYSLAKLDEVIIENRFWTETEIKKYYTYTKWRFGILDN